MLSLPLASLSTAQDADANQQKFSWQKETHELTFVIDSYGGRDSTQLIKIVQGTRIRHLVEMERFVKEGEQMIRQMQGRGVQMQADQLPISAIVRTPLLAIRWQMPSHKIRRIQVKFKSDKDFNTAFSRLQQIGLHISEHGSASNPSGIQAPAPSSTARPCLTVATSIEQTVSNTAIGSGLLCLPSRLEEISSRPHVVISAPTPFQSQPKDAAHSLPLFASVGPDRGDALISTYSSDPLNPPVRFPRPHSATADMLGRSSKNASFSEQHNSAIEEAQSAFADRPPTAMLLERPGTAEMLPPRRVLPFQRLSEPRSSGSDTGRSSDRPSTGLMGPPALPHSATQRPGSSRSAKSKDVELPPLPKPTVINKIDSEKQQPPRTPSNNASNMQGSKLEYHSHSLAMPSITHQVSNASRTSSSTVGTADAERLAAYTMQSDEGRRAALNEFIFRHLENEDFLALVEDMETAWARVALGMQ